MKKIIAVIISVLTLFCVTAISSACSKKTTVAVLQFAEHGSLDNCYNGIVEGLKQEGYSDVDIVLYNAKGVDSDNTTYAKTIINNVPDVAVGIATPSAYALASTAQNAGVPVVFSAVSDPVTSGFKDFENVTGTSDKLPIDSQVDLIRKIMGTQDTIKIGILYTKTETNSVAHIAEFKKIAASKNIEIIEAGVDKAEEIPSAIDSIISKVDCFNNLTDNTVVQNLSILLDKANAAKKPVFGSEIEQVKKGCVASCSLDYYKLGIETGKIAARILKGEKATDIDYFYVNDGYTIDYNSSVMTALGLTLPSSVDASDVIA